MRGKIKQSSQARVARNPRNPVVMYERVPCTSLRGFWKLAFPSHRIPLRSNPLGMRTPWTDRIGHPNRFINWEFSRLPICEYAIEKTSGTYVQRSARLVTPHRPGKRRAKKKKTLWQLWIPAQIYPWCNQWCSEHARELKKENRIYHGQTAFRAFHARAYSK